MEHYSHVFFNETNVIEKKKLLSKHLYEVYEYCIDNFPTKFKRNLIQIGYSEEHIEKFIKIMSFCHDFGKYNKKFQEFINSDPNLKRIFKDKKLKQHSLISALFGLFVAKYLFNSKDEKSIFFESLIFYLIKHHHSNLNDFKDEIFFIEDMNLINQQIKLISEDGYLFYSKLFEINDIKHNFEEFIEKIPSQSGFAYNNFSSIEESIYENNSNHSIYFITNTFFSLLHDADVHSASDVIYQLEKITNFDFVKEHIKKIPEDEKEINTERNEIFWKLDTKSQEIALEKRIFLITSPTGSGKTLASFNFALQLKKRLITTYGENYKIIYSIPFTSIIDQTHTVFSRLLSSSNISETILLKHHHLTDTSKEEYKDESETYISPEFNNIIIDSWNFDLVVTTFVQLFESIITNNKEMLKKVHSLYNSVIIIDECQNIPVEYWNVLKVVLRNFCEFFNTYLIFLTATQPLIFDEEDKPIQLLDDHEKYFLNKERTRIIPLLDEREFDDFYCVVREIILKETYSSILVVLNTVKDSQDFFKQLRDEVSLNEYEKIYLSASLIPKTKLDNIERIKNLNCKNKKNEIKSRYIAVTTQLIEAGVDIDNEVIFRDIAPFENLIQTAGRLNREGERRTENMYILSLKKNDKKRASTVYSSYMLKVTEEILKEKTVGLTEGNYLSIFMRYMIKKRESSNMIFNLGNSIKNLKYHDRNNTEPISSFEIIKQNRNRIPCFINLNSESHDLLTKYFECKHIQDVRLKIKSWLPYKNKFQMYIVNIPENIIKSKVENYFIKNQKNPQLIILDNSEWENYYDETLGYRDSEGIWC